jgi:deoxyribose-phosphate aldolase
MLLKANSDVLIGTVIDFPEGNSSKEQKLEEAKKAIALQADELDFVLNYTAFKEGKINLIKAEVFAATKLCIENNKVAKWIIEVAALTSEEIIVISQLIKEVVLTNFEETASKKVFVKSSTGFFKTEENKPNGATFETMKLISENAKPLQIKAAGGVRDYGTALKMISLGVDRIGTSSAKEICSKEGNINSEY